MLTIKPLLKQLTAPLIFYSTAVAAIFLGDHFAPSGPCAPGLGMLAFMLLLPITCILFLLNFYRAVSRGSAFYAVTVLHALALVILALIMKFG
jgi:hypothetical protein